MPISQTLVLIQSPRAGTEAQTVIDTEQGQMCCSSFTLSFSVSNTTICLFVSPPLCAPTFSLNFSLMSGLAALDAKCSSRLGIMTISYYLWTTFVAVVVGIVMVYIIHPGGAAQKEDSDESKKPMTSSADALLDLIR